MDALVTDSLLVGKQRWSYRRNVRLEKLVNGEGKDYEDRIFRIKCHQFSSSKRRGISSRTRTIFRKYIHAREISKNVLCPTTNVQNADLLTVNLSNIYKYKLE